MAKVTLRPLDNNAPGFGNLTLTGVRDGATVASLAIQRNQDELFLQKDGQWESQPFPFGLPATTRDDDRTQAAEIGPELVDPLLENPHTTYRAVLYSADEAGLGEASLKIKDGLMASSASGHTPTTTAEETTLSPAAMPPDPAEEEIEEKKEEQEREPAQEQPAAPSEDTTPPADTSSEPGPRKKRKVWPFVLVGILLLLGLLFGGAMLLGSGALDSWKPGFGGDDTARTTSDQKDSASEPGTATEMPEAPSSSSPAQTGAPCSLSSMESDDELAFVQSCTSSDSNDMMAVINQAMKSEHCNIARRLYAHEALDGNASVAMAYAREFDPQTHTDSACFPQADAETAVFWYETALETDPDQADAGNRIEELKP